MLTEDDFDAAVSRLYHSQQARLQTKLKQRAKQKAKPNAYPIPARLPFTKDELSLWIWRTVGLNSVLCRYCHTPIDIMSLSVDHRWPLKYGGHWDLDNLDCEICLACNKRKNAFPEQDYLLLMHAAAQMSTIGRSELFGILLNAGEAMVNKIRAQAKAKRTLEPKSFGRPKQARLSGYQDDF
jgi:5-methylcytosine-specific restriction endonuclease McrA